MNIVEGFYSELYQSQLDVKLNPHSLTSSNGIVNQGSEELTEISVDEIRLVLKKIKTNKAPGEDSVATDAIKIGDPLVL